MSTPCGILNSTSSYASGANSNTSLATKIISVKIVDGEKVDIEDPIDLSGLSPSDFSKYLQAWPIDREGTFVVHKWSRLLLLCNLARHFHNDSVRQIADAERTARLGEYSISKWQNMCESYPRRSWKEKMVQLQEAWRICRDDRLPYERLFVEAASRAPPKVLAACIDDLAGMFVVEVMKAFVLRLLNGADPAQKLTTPPRLPKIKEKKRKPRDRSQRIAGKVFEGIGRLTVTLLVVGVFSPGFASLSPAP